MPKDSLSSSHKRWAGRQRVQNQTVWTLSVGNLQARCVRNGDKDFVVQGRGDKGWTENIGSGEDPVELLRRVTASKGVANAVEQQAALAKEGA